MKNFFVASNELCGFDFEPDNSTNFSLLIKEIEIKGEILMSGTNCKTTQFVVSLFHKLKENNYHLLNEITDRVNITCDKIFQFDMDGVSLKCCLRPATPAPFKSKIKS
ncbi:MAG: hypothetical protein ACRCX2_01095 [Paraclostridium sp.]